MCRCLKVTDAVLTGVNLCFVLCFIFCFPFAVVKNIGLLCLGSTSGLYFTSPFFLHTKCKNHKFFLPAYMCLVGFSVSTQNMQS